MGNLFKSYDDRLRNEFTKTDNYNYSKILNLILNHRAKIDPFYVDKFIKIKNTQVLLYLLSNGYKPNASVDYTDEIAKSDLSRVIKFINGGCSWKKDIFKKYYVADLSVRKYLVEKGALVDKSLIRMAIESNDLKSLKYLLENGGEISSDSLKIANNLEIFKYLVDNIKVQIEDNVLKHLIVNEKREMLKYLLETKKNLVFNEDVSSYIRKYIYPKKFKLVEEEVVEIT